MIKKRDFIPDLILERFLLEVLEPERAENIRKLVVKDKELRNRVESIKKSNLEILTRYTPEKMAAQIQEKYRQEKSKVVAKRQSGWVFSLSGLAAAAIFLFIFLLPAVQTYLQDIWNPGSGDYIGIKGNARISIYRKNQDGVELLFNNSIVYEHDLIRLSYFAANFKYGIIFSIDGRGTVTLHYPSETRASTKIENEQEVYLDQAYELDDAPLFERFFFVTSENELSARLILNVAQQLANSPQVALSGDLPLPQNIFQSSIILRKEQK